MTTTTPVDIAALREAVTTYDRLTTQWYDTDEEMEASYPAAKEALHTIKDAVPALIAAIDAQAETIAALTAENERLRDSGFYTLGDAIKERPTAKDLIGAGAAVERFFAALADATARIASDDDDEGSER